MLAIGTRLERSTASRKLWQTCAHSADRVYSACVSVPEGHMYECPVANYTVKRTQYHRSILTEV